MTGAVSSLRARHVYQRAHPLLPQLPALMLLSITGSRQAGRETTAGNVAFHVICPSLWHRFCVRVPFGLLCAAVLDLDLTIFKTKIFEVGSFVFTIFHFKAKHQ